MTRRRISVTDPDNPDAEADGAATGRSPARGRSKAAADGPINVEPLKMTEVALCVLGSSPLIYNKMSAKAQRELLLPAVKKNSAAKRAELKHDPLREFRDSVYTDLNPNAATRLVFPAPGFKAATMTAALEIPGATKASVGRLLQVVGYQVRIYGIPKIFMCGVRQAGINRTPDIRTRALLERWACMVTVRYPSNSLEPASVANLLAAAGQICGVGDFRQEKGKGSFGLFSIVNQDNTDYQHLITTAGAAAQDVALASPEPFNSESAELWTWFEEELVRRGRNEEATYADVQ